MTRDGARYRAEDDDDVWLRVYRKSQNRGEDPNASMWLADQAVKRILRAPARRPRRKKEAR